MNLIAVKSGADIQAVSALANEIWHEHYASIISAAQIEYMLNNFQSIPAIRQQINEGFQYFLITVHNEALGYIGCSVESTANSLFLSKFYILKKARNQGFGGKTLARIERMACEHQLSQLHLTVNKRNTIAIAAYQKMGFDIVADLITDIGGGFVMDDYKMLKILVQVENRLAGK